jgi:hypothetical protein
MQEPLGHLRTQSRELDFTLVQPQPVTRHED